MNDIFKTNFERKYDFKINIYSFIEKTRLYLISISLFSFALSILYMIFWGINSLFKLNITPPHLNEIIIYILIIGVFSSILWFPMKLFSLLFIKVKSDCCYVCQRKCPFKESIMKVYLTDNPKKYFENLIKHSCHSFYKKENIKRNNFNINDWITEITIKAIKNKKKKEQTRIAIESMLSELK